MEDKSSLYTVEEAAERLNVKPGTIYDWTYKRLLPHVRILAGRRRAVIRFRKADIENFIEQRIINPRRPVSR